LKQGKDSIKVRYENENLWLTQKMMGQLFDVETNTITYHLKEIYESGELEKESTTRKSRVVQLEGTRKVSREIVHYNLDAIISVVAFTLKLMQAVIIENFIPERLASNLPDPPE